MGTLLIELFLHLSIHLNVASIQVLHHRVFTMYIVVVIALIRFKWEHCAWTLNLSNGGLFEVDAGRILRHSMTIWCPIDVFKSLGVEVIQCIDSYSLPVFGNGRHLMLLVKLLEVVYVIGLHFEDRIRVHLLCLWRFDDVVVGALKACFISE